MKTFKENWLSILIITLLLALVAYFVICNYFDKKTQFRAFEECLTTITNESNWTTRKDTVKYCIEQTL
jgi:YbbR domain-containing protein